MGGVTTRIRSYGKDDYNAREGRDISERITWYAQYFNRRHNRTGHLFQNRYKSILCEEESYLLALIRYIHLNPVRARIVKTMRQLRSDARKRFGYSGAEIARHLGVNTTSINRAIARAEGVM